MKGFHKHINIYNNKNKKKQNIYIYMYLEYRIFLIVIKYIGLSIPYSIY